MTPATVDSAKEARDNAQTQVTTLRESEGRLLGAIDKLADEARQGKAGSGRSLVELSGELGSIRAQLQTAEAALASAELALESATITEQRARFETRIDEAQAARLKFIEALRAACLHLGEYCVATQEAIEISNILSRYLELQIPVKNSIAEVCEPIDPLAGFLEAGRNRAWDGYGFKLSFPCSPIIPIGEK
jgi:hypothetical protein